ncbi:MAG: GDP-mannose 4,6-dehydratase [Clostridia bacterium]|nr:GDP-mannose 4,6-dehydratase [Clostridia bacterium]
MNGTTVLVTGSPGFIGANLVLRLLREMKSGRIISFDNMNDYYDPALKRERLAKIEKTAAGPVSHLFVEGNLADREKVRQLFERERPRIVVNLAAQAGVRYSIECPEAYIESNILGFFNILECCRHYPVEHLVYASSSSVYGGSRNVPFSTEDRVDSPVSLYAATKKSDELLAHSYAKLYDIPCTGLRFFTVYGPCGRPDMFYFSATKTLAAGGTIRIFNYGNCERDFTYVDDTVEGILRVMQGAPDRRTGDDGLPVAPSRIYNIGSGHPENLMTFVTVLHQELIAAGILPASDRLEDHVELTGMQPGDVPVTCADCTPLKRDFGFTPTIGIREGLRQFARWYKAYYG